MLQEHLKDKYWFKPTVIKSTEEFSYVILSDPKSCKDVLTSNLNKGDGEYDLYLIWPSCNRTARVYCADMGTSTPVEYVTLPAGDAKNFAVYFNSNKGNRREQTNFEKVRNTLPFNFYKTDDASYV